jgi:hypothetical protein
VAHCLEESIEQMNSGHLEDFLQDQQIPTVIGPNAPEGFYITDKHHLVYALFSASFDNFKHPMQHRTMYVQRDYLLTDQICIHELCM